MLKSPSLKFCTEMHQFSILLPYFTGNKEPQVLYGYRQFILALVPATDLKEVVQVIVYCADLC